MRSVLFTFKRAPLDEITLISHEKWDNCSAAYKLIDDEHQLNRTMRGNDWISFYIKNYGVAEVSLLILQSKYFI